MEADGVLNGFDYLGNWIELVGDRQVEDVVQGHRDVTLSGVSGLAVLARMVKRTDVQKLDCRPPYLDDEPVRLALSVDLWLTEMKRDYRVPAPVIPIPAPERPFDKLRTEPRRRLGEL